MENIKDNLELPMKNINIIGKQIYNTKTDKYGMVTGIHVQKMVGKLGHYFEAYYDKIDSDTMIFTEDLYNGTLQFVIINMPILEKIKEKNIEEIKEFMGDRFCGNTIRYITEEQHKKHCSEQEWRGIQEIMGKAKELDSLAADVVMDNYSMLKYFTLFIDGIITENQMLYGLVNILSAELRLKKDNEIKGFSDALRKETMSAESKTAFQGLASFMDYMWGNDNGTKGLEKFLNSDSAVIENGDD